MVTRGFTARLEGSLPERGSQGAPIGTVLAATVGATTMRIGDQFERIRPPRARKAIGPRPPCARPTSRPTAEMAEALGGAAARFRDTMGELRGMTGQIQRELDATRAELRRGVVELPQETQETTANMRRVVADQIKASERALRSGLPFNRIVDAAPAAPAAQDWVNETPGRRYRGGLPPP